MTGCPECGNRDLIVLCDDVPDCCERGLYQCPCGWVGDVDALVTLPAESAPQAEEGS